MLIMTALESALHFKYFDTKYDLFQANMPIFDTIKLTAP